MTPRRIVLAEDHAIFRDALKGTIELEPDLHVVGMANDGLELLDVLREVAADMVILDLSMPNLGGIEVISEVKGTYPKLKVIVLTMHKETEFISQAIVAGADGYVFKGDSMDNLFSAIKTTGGGGKYVSASVQDELYWGENYILGEKPTLTSRERSVLKLVSDGKTNKEIADLLFISIRTVENHRFHIKRKLGVKKTVDLIKYTLKNDY